MLDVFRCGALGGDPSHSTKWPAFLEEFFEDFTAFHGQHASRDPGLMVETRIRDQPVQTGTGTRLGIGRPIDQSSKAALHNRPCAHAADPAWGGCADKSL